MLFFLVLIVASVLVVLCGSLWPYFALCVWFGLVFLVGLVLAGHTHRDQTDDARHRAPVARR